MSTLPRQQRPGLARARSAKTALSAKTARTGGRVGHDTVYDLATGTVTEIDYQAALDDGGPSITAAPMGE